MTTPAHPVVNLVYEQCNLFYLANICYLIANYEFVKASP